MEELLKKSIAEYNLILCKAIEIEELLTKMDSEAITRQASALETLLSNSQKTDNFINSSLKQHPDILEHPFFLQRSHLMEQILKKNKEITPKIQGILAVYKTEFQKMRTGMQSMNGYSTEKKTTGKLVNNKF